MAGSAGAGAARGARGGLLVPLSGPPSEPSRIDSFIVATLGSEGSPADRADGGVGNLGSLLLAPPKRFGLRTPVCPPAVPAEPRLEVDAPVPSAGNKHGALEFLEPMLLRGDFDTGGDGGAIVVSNPRPPRTDSAIERCIAPPDVLRGVGDGGGLGRFLTFAQIGMCRSAACSVNCLKQCWHCTMPGCSPVAGLPGEAGAGESPRPARQACTNWVCSRLHFGVIARARCWTAASCFCSCRRWYFSGATKTAPVSNRWASALKTFADACVGWPSTPLGRAFLSLPQICWCWSMRSGLKWRPQ
mmetsp:Transcript_80225/g.227152  ORF Transcript_80225/g.227152 Transcript_80225/m.227152 type:complete len:301 (-) Transcript_80225:405-1307(-)